MAWAVLDNAAAGVSVASLTSAAFAATAGDLIVVAISSNTTLAATHPVKDNNNVDLTLYPGTQFIGNAEIDIYYKVADGTETSITVTLSAGGALIQFSVFALSDATATPTDVAAGRTLAAPTVSTTATGALDGTDTAALFLIGGTISESYSAMTNLGTVTPTWTLQRNSVAGGDAIGIWTTTFTGPSGTLNQQVTATGTGTQSLAVATFKGAPVVPVSQDYPFGRGRRMVSWVPA